jgi:hypothetical protein
MVFKPRIRQEQLDRIALVDAFAASIGVEIPHRVKLRSQSSGTLEAPCTRAREKSLKNLLIR